MLDPLAFDDNLHLSVLVTFVLQGKGVVERRHEQMDSQLHCMLLHVGVLARCKLLLALLHYRYGLDHQNV